MLAIYRWGPGGRDTWDASLSAFALDSILLSAFYLIVLLLGSPLWPILDRFLFRAWWAAPLFGAAVTLLGWAGLIAINNRGPIDATLLMLVIAMTVSNALAGWVIWRIAHRRDPA